MVHKFLTHYVNQKKKEKDMKKRLHTLVLLVVAANHALPSKLVRLLMQETKIQCPWQKEDHLSLPRKPSPETTEIIGEILMTSLHLELWLMEVYFCH